MSMRSHWRPLQNEESIELTSNTFQTVGELPLKSQGRSVALTSLAGGNPFSRIGSNIILNIAYSMMAATKSAAMAPRKKTIHLVSPLDSRQSVRDEFSLADELT